MALYTGETVQVRHRADDYNGKPLTGADVTVAVTIWGLDGTTVLVDEAAMTYSSSLVFDDGSKGGWFYHWRTPIGPGSEGAYLARCTVTGQEINAWEFKTIRLRKDKV